MRQFTVIALAVSLLGSIASAAPTPIPVAPRSTVAPAVSPRLQVLFSPGGGCTEAIVEALGKARTSVDVQAYSFTSAPIADAVAKAFARGVKIRVVLDKSQRSERYTSATYLANHNVPTWIDTKHAIAHNKIILIDGATIFTGSFNFTKAAEQKNAENLLIIQGDPKLYAEYESNFEEHLSHSEKFERASTDKSSTMSPAADDDGLGGADAPKPVTNKPASKRSRKAA